MCGIAGFYNKKQHHVQESTSLIRRMADTLLHRGPDQDGYYVDNYIALGHRRLSIIDLSGGRQPIASKDNRYQIIFNGEIYNFQPLQSELKDLGYTFTTNSDTEVLLAAYIHWGKSCLNKMNGMFAFAIWDAKEHTLFLARDRVGKKPLYYFHHGNTFAFASELKALRVLDEWHNAINYQALDCYYSLGYIPSPLTIYNNVFKLEPGHCLTVDPNGLKKERYWTLSFNPQESVSLNEATEEFEALLDDAVRCRLISEVPLGAFLSGGLDSTLVVSSMQRVLGSPVLTNTIGFEGIADELELAASVSAHLGTNHKEFTLAPDSASILQGVVQHFDEPFADSSAIPTWYVCQAARQNVTVALSGDGGDESFGGYTFRYLPHMFEASLRGRIPVPLRSLCFGTLGSMWPGSAKLPKWLRLKTIFENLAGSNADAFYKDLIWLRPDSRDKLYTQSFIDGLMGFTPFEMVEPLYKHLDFSDSALSGADQALMRAQFTDVNFYMTEDVLVKVDRMSMAHSLEVRSPLLDYRLIEFAANLPPNLKLNKHKGKLVLRELAKKRLPQSILSQPKTGFSMPVADWLRNELNPLLKEAVSGSSEVIGQTLDQEVLLKMCREHETGERDHNVFLWGVLMLHMWEKHVYSC